jgi:AraC-like DNA-binding protein
MSAFGDERCQTRLENSLESTFRVLEASTDSVPPSQRLDFWVAHSSSELVGLRCSTFAAEGLHAWQRNVDLGRLRLADIRGNEHIIERPRPMLRTHPKDSIFANLLMEGEAFFYQAGRCIPVHAGDVIIYPTEVPYLYGFTGSMRQLQVDIGTCVLLDGRRIERPTAPRKIDASLPAGRAFSDALRSAALSFLEQPTPKAAPGAAERMEVLTAALLQEDEAARTCSEAALLRRLRAESFIAEHLADPDLDAAAVARFMSLSVRHLNRMFQTGGTTVNRWILRRRLEAARAELATLSPRAATIGDVAARWAFPTQAHFANCFRAEFGITPSEHRHQVRMPAGSSSSLRSAEAEGRDRARWESLPASSSCGLGARWPMKDTEDGGIKR